MADNFQINLGSLRSSVNLTLHTHHAARMWLGRQRTDGKPGMIGLSGFASIINRMTAAAAKDDPYSDYFLILIERKVEDTEQALADIDERLDLVMAHLPPQLELGNNLSIQPLKLPLYLGSPIAFKAVYLLTRYDELVRRIMLAWHVGLIDSWQPPANPPAEAAEEDAEAREEAKPISATRIKEMWLDEGAAALRRLFSLGQRYKGFSGASRDDIAANNARAANAKQMYAFLGELPAGVLKGTERSRFAPVIQRSSDASNPADQGEYDPLEGAADESGVDNPDAVGEA
ncbi:conjugal transfer protein [Pseudomonas oryzihabitans]|nr:conjugal transfer protein [Pseudomonas psychrotolerans]